MKHNSSKIYIGVTLPLVFSSVTMIAAQVNASPQQTSPAQQINNLNYNYVGGGSDIGIRIDDKGNGSIDINTVLSEDNNSMTSGGLWAGVNLSADDSTVQAGGARLNHHWVVRDKQGKAHHINKTYLAYDRNENKHAKTTVGFGQETQSSFWEGHISKGLSSKNSLSSRQSTTSKVAEKAYDYGVGATVGTHVTASNLRVRTGMSYQWGDEQNSGEKQATLLSLSAGVEKFFQGTPHSIGVEVSAHEKSGGYENGSQRNTVRSNLNYRYNFGGDSVFQPDKRYRRVRVEIPEKARATRYEKRAIYRNQTKQIPVYGSETVKVPYKQLVKSTMELEAQTFFQLDRANLTASAQIRLQQIATHIRKNGYKGVIRITGNTCQLGDTLYDQRLSEQRAASVRAFLVKQGFNPHHLIVRGLGKSNPKYPVTPDQDFKNRRVDIEYISEQSRYKTGYRNITQKVQTGTRTINQKMKVGYEQVLIDKGSSDTARVVWRTEVIPTAPSWIKRALHHTLKHQRGVATYLTTTTGNPTPPSTPNPTPDTIDDDNNDAYDESCCTVNIPINIGPEGDSFIVLAEGDKRSIIKVTSSAGFIEIDTGDSTKHTLFFEPKGYVGTATLTYTLSDGSRRTISIECYD